MNLVNNVGNVKCNRHKMANIYYVKVKKKGTNILHNRSHKEQSYRYIWLSVEEAIVGCILSALCGADS